MDHRKLTGHPALIFDFDGTVAQLFADYPLEQTAALLEKQLRPFGVNFSAEQDVFESFAVILIHTFDSEKERLAALACADRILTEAECRAVDSCRPVPGVEDAFRKFSDAGIPFGIATNNSVDCIRLFLKQRCGRLPVPIVGRSGLHPELLKPNPYSLHAVLQLLNRPVENAVFFGDSVSDFFCAQNLGCRFLGMGPTVKKHDRLLSVLPEEEIFSDYTRLLDELRAEGIAL